MVRDIETLSRELARAQLLLRASHELYEEILVEISRSRITRSPTLGRDISERIVQFAEREQEIIQMISRLDALVCAPTGNALTG